MVPPAHVERALRRFVCSGVRPRRTAIVRRRERVAYCFLCFSLAAERHLCTENLFGPKILKSYVLYLVSV